MMMEMGVEEWRSGGAEEQMSGGVSDGRSAMEVELLMLLLLHGHMTT